MKSSQYAVFVCLVVLNLVAPNASGQFSAWTISEMQPDIQQGGRANSIAVNPLNDNTMIAASESGGIFRSSDRGVTWRHVDGFPTFRMSSVIYLPADPNIVLASTWRDFRSVNGGGVWRSADGGTTWTQMPGAPAPAGSTETLSAYEISIAPDSGTIYVATTYGVSYSADRGLTWAHVNPFGAANRHVYSVIAMQNNLVIAAGTNGIRRSTDGGLTWTPAASWPGGSFGNTNIHSFGRSPYWIDQAYVVDGNWQLYYTADGGNRWTRILNTPPGSYLCGGITFIKAQAAPRIPPAPVPPDRAIVLWFGNACSVSTLYCPELSARTFNYSGTWVTLTTDHGDTRDLAFDNTGQALILATDGGLHGTANGGTNWTFTGGGHNGYNALQVNEIRGQSVAAANRYDLYFATQDNNLWASSDGGRNWINPVGAEGNNIEALHRVGPESDSQVTFVACGPCSDYLSASLFRNLSAWPNPPATGGDPKILEHSFHVQGVNGGAGAPLSKGFAYTTTLGLSWQQYATFPEDRLQLPKLTRPFLVPVLYQAIRTSMTNNGRSIDKLARITRRVGGSTAFVTYPAMNNFGGLGTVPTMFAWYEVFAVDPANSLHLIAPDLINEKMMTTSDGGNNWTEIPGLTSLVTDSGRFLFGYEMFTHASAISFNQDNPNLVAIGTTQGGVLISADRGTTWSRVAQSDRATYITSIEWKSATEAIISTYGRGLWRLTSLFVLWPPQFDAYCNLPCTILPFGPSTEQYTRGVLVFNGQIEGAGVSKGVLQELFVTPGSSVAFVADSGGVKITESDKNVGFTGATPPAAPAKQSMVGLTIGKGGNLLGAAFTQNPLLMYQPTDTEKNQDKNPVGSDKSPTAGKPYLALNIGGPVGPQTPLNLTGTDFAPGTSIEITLDDATVAKLKIGEKGDLTVTITAPHDAGPHAVKVLDSSTRKLVDGAIFVVANTESN